MPITTMTGGSAGGLNQFLPGKSVFTEGTDFKCTATICFGVGKDNHNFLQQLQAEINRYAKTVGFAPLTIDGFIGTKTVKAAQLAAKHVASVEPDFGPKTAHPAIFKGLVDGTINTKQQVAANALAIFGVLGAWAEGKLPPAAPIPPPEAKPAPVPPPAVAVTREPQPTLPPPPGEQIVPGAEPAAVPAAKPEKKPSTVIWWVIGGIAAATVVGVVGYVVYRTRARRRRRGAIEIEPAFSGPTLAGVRYRRRKELAQAV